MFCFNSYQLGSLQKPTFTAHMFCSKGEVLTCSEKHSLIAWLYEGLEPLAAPKKAVHGNIWQHTPAHGAQTAKTWHEASMSVYVLQVGCISTNQRAFSENKVIHMGSPVSTCFAEALQPLGCWVSHCITSLCDCAFFFRILVLCNC